jgi:hypothetical protein
MKKLSLALFVFFISSCSSKHEEKASNALYFDIAGYFDGEAQRLAQTNPTISKTVYVKGGKENKLTRITNWKTELAIFKDADINKASWRGEFNVNQTENATSYTTNNNKIATRKVEVHKIRSEVVSIKIFKETNNYLYKSTDTLVYYPDSLYEITSHQKIKLLSAKTYTISGKAIK